MGKRGPKPRTELNVDELDILARMADGDTDEEIAVAFGRTRLQMIDRTRQIFRILGARNRTHAVALGYQRGLLPTTGGVHFLGPVAEDGG